MKPKISNQLEIIRGLNTFLFLFLFATAGFSQITLIGQQSVCKNEVEVYALQGNTSVGIYTWTITPALGVINFTSNNSIVIQWHTAGNCTIEVSSGATQIASLSVVINTTKKPTIQFNEQVGCQNISNEVGQVTNTITDDENECVNVCENTIVEYKSYGTLVYNQNMSEFYWEVSGGEIVEVDGITQNPSTSVATSGSLFTTNGTFSKIKIKWGSVGHGSIKVTELTPYVTPTTQNPTNCTSKSSLLCIDIIEKPISNFLVNGNIIEPNQCYPSCLNQTLYLSNLSTGSAEAPILFYKWDFCDGSAISHLENPSHSYTASGNYIITLTTTNRCNCTSTHSVEICVSDVEGAEIICPSVVCENDIMKYSVEEICSNYNFTLFGGTVVTQNGPELEVRWDHVDDTGFGYISFDAQSCEETCQERSIMKIPVIKQVGIIKGSNTACTNKSYLFELPQWPATNFTWSLQNNTSGATFLTLIIRDNFAEILSGSNPGSFDLICEYENTVTKNHCSGTASIHVEVIVQPTINTTEKSCINTAIPCSLLTNGTMINLTDNVIWKATSPNGSTLSFTSNSNPFSFPNTAFATAGTYRISAQSVNSQFCEPELIEIEIVETPTTPTNVVGEDFVCQYTPYLYTTDVIENTITHWTIVGAMAPLTAEGSSKTITWNTPSTKSITLYREREDVPGCISQSYTKTINSISFNGSITGPNNTFEDVADNYIINLTNGVVPEIVEWTIIPATAGIVSLGQGTTSITVTWMHQTNPLYNVILKCNITKCGTAYTATHIINIDKSASITSITASPSPVCGGTPTSFTVNSSGALVNEYLVDFGDGNNQSFIPGSPTNAFSFDHSFVNNSLTSVAYPVKIKVRSSNNNLISATQVYSIQVNPSPNLTLSPNITQIPPSSFPIQLNVATTASTGNSFQWYFNETGTSTNLNIGSNSNQYSATATPPSGASSSFGNYWCVVTNSFGCSKQSNQSAIYDFSSGNPNGSGGGCAALAPAGITNMPASIIESVNCGSSVQVSCTTAGTLSVNISSFNWSVYPLGYHTATGSQSQNQSPLYAFSAAGIYKVTLDVNYLNSVSGQPDCVYKDFCYVTVPMVADMQWGIACNATGNGYILQLIDNSTLMPNYNLTSRTWDIYAGTTLVTTINGLNSQNVSYTIPASYYGSTLEAKLSITNSIQGSSVVCTQMQSIIVPNLPVADFTMLTTYPGNPSSPYKSCEEREISFINNSTPLNNLHTHFWNFNNGSESYLMHTAVAYYVSSTILSFSPSLTVTDNHGCWDTKAKQIEIFDKTLQKVATSQYLPASAAVCADLLISPALQPNFMGGSAPLSYSWYKGTELLTAVTTSTLGYAYKGTGAYWVKITDKNNCILNLNPSPALVSEKGSPTALIQGKVDLCQNSDLTRYRVSTGMPASANLSYTWVLNGTTLAANTKEIQLYPTSLLIGSNQLQVTVTDLSSGGCSVTSSPFFINLHQPPQNLTISGPTALNRDLYELELTGSATSSSGAPLSYSWSTGASGQSISVFNGGAYRLWVTDQYGCQNHTDIAVQYAPDYYFWRFPTGCYSYCETDMPKKVWPSSWTYGNGNILFDDWAWLHNGNPVQTNGPSSGGCTYGSNPGTPSIPSIPCRLWIDNSEPNLTTGLVEGEGEGTYQWMLSNGLCSQVSDMMDVSIAKCCTIPITINNIACSTSIHNLNAYDFDITVENIPCETSFNLSIIDNNDWPLQIIGSSLTPQQLSPGNNQIIGSFIATPTSTSIKFIIHILCANCSGESQIENLPSCGGTKMIKTDSLHLAEISAESDLQLYPNPAKNHINIQYRMGKMEANNTLKLSLVLMNAHGRVLKEIPCNQSEGTLQYNTADLEQGVYFIGLKREDLPLKAVRFVIIK